ETSAHCPGYQVIAALPPFDIAAGAIDGRHRAIRTGGKDECTIDGWRQLIVVLALTITHLDAPEPLQTDLLLEVHEFCRLLNVVIAEHAATTQGQQGYGQHSISHLLL